MPDQTTPAYLEVDDHNPRKAIGVKLSEAVALYVQRFQRQPTIVLMNADDLAETTSAPQGVQLKAESRMRRNCFQVGAL